jgi:N-acyl-D-amino-acid deacylase
MSCVAVAFRPEFNRITSKSRQIIFRSVKRKACSMKRELKDKNLSRRGLLGRLAGVGSVALGAEFGLLPGLRLGGKARAADPLPGFVEGVPISGKAGPGLEPFDPAMIKIMDRNGIPGAAFAIAYQGKLVLAKAYGWANAPTGQKVQPDTRFGLASLSKPITAVAILKLVEQKKLTLEDQVFDILSDIQPAMGARVDPRLAKVTLRQCLNHTGGWDRKVAGDPVNWEPQICRAFKVAPPLNSRQLISFTMGMPLQVAPGTDTEYSNIGYILAGEVVAKVSGQTYGRFVEEQILLPMGIKRTFLWPAGGKYLPDVALRHLAGALTTLPPMQLPMVDAAGGWAASVVDLMRFLTNIDKSRGQSVLNKKMRDVMREPPWAPVKKRKNGTWFGLGWDIVDEKEDKFSYYKEGSYQGMRTFMKRLHNGINWALMYNASMEFDPVDTRMVTKTVDEVQELVDRIDTYPDIDLFDEYA